jgi:hypothetical protein
VRVTLPLSDCFLTYCCKCYLRLTTLEHVRALLEAARSNQSASGLGLELFEGPPEEVYWENALEKVRALAVQPHMRKYIRQHRRMSLA